MFIHAGPQLSLLGVWVYTISTVLYTRDIWVWPQSVVVKASEFGIVAGVNPGSILTAVKVYSTVVVKQKRSAIAVRSLSCPLYGSRQRVPVKVIGW